MAIQLIKLTNAVDTGPISKAESLIAIIDYRYLLTTEYEANSRKLESLWSYPSPLRQYVELSDVSTLAMPYTFEIATRFRRSVGR